MPRCYFIAVGWWGGNSSIRRQFKALADELAARGHRVVIIVERGPPDVVAPEANPAIHLWPSARPTRLRDAWFLLGLLRRYRPDAVIANWAAVNWVILLGTMVGVRHRIAWYHTLTAQLRIDRGERFGLREHLQRWRKRWVYRAATRIVAVSEAAGTDVQREFGVPAEKCVVFYNSLADPLVGKAPLPPDVRRVVCVGRLDRSKGQDVLIRAASLLKEEMPDARFEFVGLGRCQEEYQRLARELGVHASCRFLGAVSADGVLQTLRQATAAVVPSRSDNCPLVVVEALASGVPVIGSAVGGIAEMVRDEVDGFLVPPDDPVALADRLRVVLGSPETRAALSRSARERYFDMFDLKRSVETQVSWVDALIAQPPVGE